MMRRVHIAMVACAALVSLRTQAQAWEAVPVDDLLEKVKANEKKYDAMPAFKLSAVVLAYQNVGDVLPSDRGTSTVWKSGKRSRSEHMGMVTYQDERVRVLIDPEEHMIYLSEPFDILQMMGPSFQKDLLGTVLSIGRSTQGDGTHFRMKFPATSEYDIVEVLFDKEGWLRRIDTYWAHPMPVDPGNAASALIRPKVVVEMAVPQVVDPTSVEADPASVVALHTKAPVALGPWKDYQVFDTRVK